MLDRPAIAAGPAAAPADHTAADTEAPADLHRSPPLTLRTIRHRWPWLAPAALGLFAVLGIAAAFHGGTAIVWDRPITHAAVALRSPALDRTAHWASRLGSTPVVLAAGAVGVALAARRCRSVALVLLVTVTMRPPVEWLVKELVARPRPSGARLVVGTGFSYPSGHVLAAAATWGFLPLIAALYVRRRWLWWTFAAAAGSIVAAVAWSRVWLGVHWTSDVVGSVALAFVVLSAAETAIDRLDRDHGHSPGATRTGRAPAMGAGALPRPVRATDPPLG